MKKQAITVAAALLGLGLAACHKTPTAENEANPAANPPVPSIETKMKEAYGFAAQVPANEEGYAAFYKLGQLWKDIKQSKTWTDIRTNPLVAEALENPSYLQMQEQLSTNPEAAKWRAILSDALGNEAFVVFAPGSGEALRNLVRLSDESRLAQLETALSGSGAAKGGNAQMQKVRTMLPLLSKLNLPPMIMGFKVASQKAALDAELSQAEQNLPQGLESGSFTINGNIPFKSIAVTLGKVLPAAQQDMFKLMVTQDAADPAEAEKQWEALLARHLEVAYGYVGDYLIVSIGPDHSHLKLAQNFGESLLSRPEMKVAANYTDKSLLSFSWSSAELLSASVRGVEFTPYYERLKPQLSGKLSQSDLARLEDDVKRVDGEGKTVFSREFEPMMGVIYRDHGLRSECYGGEKISAGAPMKFTGVPSPTVFLWADWILDRAKLEACRVWGEDLISTAYSTFQRIGLPYIPEEQRGQFTMFDTMAAPKIVELYKISRDQFAKSLGDERAFVLDLNGDMPDFPMIPPPIHDGGKLFRLGYLSDVQNPALLAESWNSYFKLAQEIAQMVPQAALLGGALPSPKNETVDGVTLSYYPTGTGDLLPNVATTDKTFVAGTSRSYSLELSKAALKSSAAPKPLRLDLRMNFKPAYDFAEKWLTLAAQHPELAFHGNEEQAEQFKKSEPNIVALLHALQGFDGFDVQCYEENGQRRVTSSLRWNGQ